MRWKGDTDSALTFGVDVTEDKEAAVILDELEVTGKGDGPISSFRTRTNLPDFSDLDVRSPITL